MRLAIAFAAVLWLAKAPPGPAARISPASAKPGALVRILVTDSAGAESVTSVRGTMAGEPLHFVVAGPGRWRAIGPVPTDASGRVTARVFVDRGSQTDTIVAAAQVPRLQLATSRLQVDTTFTRPLDSATTARIADENRRVSAMAREAHGTPRQWTRPFLRPRASVITSNFGTGRILNGKVTSRHLGVDFRGMVGEPVRAANRGIVALIDTFFLAGNVVYIDHGVGVVTGYFHLSKPLVAAGDTVERGQQIGLVGATGRVTGAHLHWSARYGAVAVNPLDLVALGSTW
jgi:murein DD-endopeptidase MepM/ murein hydrolase activator NlpD